MHGALAQLVEQWTENPCVPGSIPGGTTRKTLKLTFRVFCCNIFPKTICFSYKECVDLRNG